MALNTEPKYPNRRTYVVRVRGDATPDKLAGRLENLATSRQRAFTSSHELVDMIATDLGASNESTPSHSR